MCIIKNEEATTVLKGLRDLDANGFEGKSNTELTLLAAQTTTMVKEIEPYLKALKAELVRRNIETTYIPLLEKKVFLSPGKKNTQYDMKKIITDFEQADMMDELCLITTVVKKRIEENGLEDDETIQVILDEHSTSGKGDPYVTVAKMNQNELAEHIGK